MKKILLHKNKSSTLLVKNSLLLSGFLEQIRHFINKSIYSKEMQQNSEETKVFILEGKQTGTKSPKKQRNGSPESQHSDQQKTTTELNNTKYTNFKARDKTFDEKEMVFMAKEYIDILK